MIVFVADAMGHTFPHPATLTQSRPASESESLRQGHVCPLSRVSTGEKS